ncbi:hypothetical protein TNCV_5052751 [Trichonephila clavipes]|nr:hypothetical protein TNCV_5052751 [Trichonephila clavipes]
MQRDCALCKAVRGCLTSFSVKYNTGNQSLFECVESFTKKDLSCEEVFGSVDPRDVIYTKTRLRTPSTDQLSRRPPHRKKCTRAALDTHPSTLPFGVVPFTRKLDCSGMEPGRL